MRPRKVPDIFVTVPRLRGGIPSSLNKLTVVESEWKMEPWPSWEMNRHSGDSASTALNCTPLQNVQSMEIDPTTNLMWVVDVGRTEIFGDKPNNMCPPKLTVFDVATGRALNTVVFGPEVADPTTSFLNDIVIDAINQVGFITDASKKGGIIAVRRPTDYKGRCETFRFNDPSTEAEPDFKLRVQGTDCPGAFPSDGIAYNPVNNRVYYCPLSGLDVYSVDFTNFVTMPKAEPCNVGTIQNGLSNSLRKEGQKPDATDGMAMDSEGVLYFGGLQNSAVYKWDSTKGVPLEHVAPTLQSEKELHWVDTFGFMPGSGGGLIFTANKLEQLIFKSYNFSRGAEANVRIQIYSNGARSYMSDGPPAVGTTKAPEPKTENPNADTHELLKDILIAVGSLSALLVLLSVYTCVQHARKKKEQRVWDDALAPFGEPDSDDDLLIDADAEDINRTNVSSFAGNNRMRNRPNPLQFSAPAAPAAGPSAAGYGNDDHVYE